MRAQESPKSVLHHAVLDQHLAIMAGGLPSESLPTCSKDAVLRSHLHICKRLKDGFARAPNSSLPHNAIRHSGLSGHILQEQICSKVESRRTKHTIAMMNKRVKLLPSREAISNLGNLILTTLIRLSGSEIGMGQRGHRS
eukprot:3423516-Amphidinium_carterae.1